MLSPIVWIALIGSGVQVIGNELTQNADNVELTRYVNRVTTLHQRMKSEGCSLPQPDSVAKKQSLVAGTVKERLRTEKALFNQYVALLVACRKEKLMTQVFESTSTTLAGRF